MKLMILFITLIFLLSACVSLYKEDKTRYQKPELKFEPKLIYPLEAQNTNRSGISTVMFTIAEDGTVEETSIFKSSGHPDLDEAAERFCKGLVFHPAKRDGDPVQSKMKWQVRFDLTDLTKNLRWKINEVNLHYKTLKRVYADTTRIQNDILNIHKDVIGKIKDGEKFNFYMYNVIQNGIIENWKGASNNFPLSFLLYHDFITRFEDYEDKDSVKSLLKKAAETDLNYLESNDDLNEKFGINKKLLIQKIKDFLQKYYL